MVLDASGAIELLLHTPRGRRFGVKIAEEAEVIHAPHLIDVEVAHVLRRYVLRHMLEERRAALALQHWRQLQVERYPHEPFLNRVWALRGNVSAYDAVYVALAEALGTVLFTGDRRLASAPGMDVRIELV